MLINSGNGLDTIAVNGPLGGNASILTGLSSGTGDTTTLSGRIGGSLTYDSTYGNDSVISAAAGATIGGSASLIGVGTKTGSNLTLTGPLSVGGNLTITTLSAAYPLDVTGAGALTVGSTTSTNIGGAARTLSVTGTAGSNTFAPSGGLYVSGNASFNFAASSGTSTLDLSAAGNAGSTIAGNLSFQGGAGNTVINLPATVAFFVNGNATLNTGNGVATLGLAGTGWFVAGSLSINAGNGNNTDFTVGGMVGGNETITQGNGNNVQATGVTVNNPPGGLFIYQGGNGTDALDLEGPDGSAYQLYLTFGTGMNTLSLDLNPATTITFSGTVLGSGGTDVFVQGPNAMLVNYYTTF